MEHLTISLFLTQKCPSRCRHCGTSSTPVADRDFDLEEIKRFIEKIAETPNVEAVGFSGGEVFMVKDLLHAAVEELRKFSIPYTFVTNAFWATSFDVAKEVLSDFTDTIGMGLSADPFHQEFVPIERVINATRAAEELEIPYTIRATMRESDKKEDIEKDLKDAGLNNLEVIQFSPLMYIGSAREGIPPEDFPDENKGGPCLSLRTPFLFSRGDLFACCGEAGNIEGRHPLYLGNIKDGSLMSLFEKYENDPYLVALYTIGPRGLWELLGDTPKDIEEELLLRSPCGTCRLIFGDKDRTKRLNRILKL